MTDDIRNSDMWPAAHPDTGEPFVDGTITTENNAQLVQRLIGPSPPTRELYETVETCCDECGEPHYEDVYVRDLTDEEYAAAWAAYEKASAEFERTGGRFYVAGCPETRGEFVTASGATAEGAWAEGYGWQWARWSVARNMKEAR
jgi:hypothetical protein